MIDPNDLRRGILLDRRSSTPDPDIEYRQRIARTVQDTEQQVDLPAMQRRVNDLPQDSKDSGE